jgi:hypothetical protein
MDQPQPKQPQQMNITDNIAGAEYTNAAQIQHNKEEFRLIFLNVFPPTGRTAAKIITSPGHFKKMIAAMQSNLEQYETRFGKIEDVPEVTKEIGFKEA